MNLQEILKKETPFIIQCEEVGCGLTTNIIGAITSKFKGIKDVVEIRLSMVDLSDIQRLKSNDEALYIFNEVDRATSDVLTFIDIMVDKNFIGISHNPEFKFGEIPIYKYGVDDIFEAEFSDIFSSEFVKGCEIYFGGGNRVIENKPTTHDATDLVLNTENKVVDIPLSDANPDDMIGNPIIEKEVTLNDAEDVLGYPYIIKDNIFNNGTYARKMLQQIRDGLKFFKENKLIFGNGEYISHTFLHFLFFDTPTGLLKKFTCEQGLFLREKGVEILINALKEKLDIYINKAMIDYEEIRNRDINDNIKSFKREVEILRNNLHKQNNTVNNDIDVRKDVISKMVEQNNVMIDEYYKQVEV